MINQLKTRLAVSEQEVKDKDEVMKKTSDLLHTEQEHKVQGLQVKPCIISGGGGAISNFLSHKYNYEWFMKFYDRTIEVLWQNNRRQNRSFMIEQ